MHHGLLIYLRAANNHHLMGHFRHLDRTFKRIRYIDAVRVPVAVAGNDNRTAARQRAANAAKRLAPHDHRLAHGQRLEMLQVGRQMPWQVVILADSPVFGHGHNHGNHSSTPDSL